ncbi:MAG: hypothetical protein DMG86_18110 [Acidobacteria bacterium]|jgi:hypothetical protein|nr:MAG: hypothetical protein DMG86_18110 [Acidobacteriota bacterium]
MKTLLSATLAMCLALSVVAVAQDSPSQAPQKDQAGSTAQLTTLSGTIKAEGDKLTFVNDTDQKAWTVDNPGTLKGHEGHHVQVKAHVNADKESIHIAEVKMLPAGNSNKNDMK